MNYIFVDIDGCMLPEKMHLFPVNQKITRKELNDAEPLFDNFAVQCFNIWAKYADAKIVFSTNWASALKNPELQLPEIMEANGLEFNYHEEILTPKKFTSQRGSEIWWWLLDNAKDGDKFIAVDDDQSCKHIDGFIESAKERGYVEVKDFTGKWIDVDYKNGLSWENFVDGCTALDIDLEDVNEQEFGIKRLTAEEKEAREKALDLLINCMI